MHLSWPSIRQVRYTKGREAGRSRDRTQPARPKRTTPRVAKRGLKPGRLLIASGLVGFVLTAAAVVARRSYGHQEGVRTAELQRTQATLESERIRLEAAIRNASSRPRLGPIAEKRLGMRVPADSQVVILSRSTRSGGTP